MHLPASRIVNHPFCVLRQWIRVSFYVKQLLDEIFASIDCVNPSPLEKLLNLKRAFHTSDFRVLEVRILAI